MSSSYTGGIIEVPDYDKDSERLGSRYGMLVFTKLPQLRLCKGTLQ
jgi:hypothetical protein